MCCPKLLNIFVKWAFAYNYMLSDTHAERKRRDSRQRRTKSSLEDVVISAVDKPDAETNADQLAEQRQQLDPGPVSVATAKSSSEASQ